METEDYLSYLVNEIHTAVVATVDDEGNPVTAAIDLMDEDDSGIYFLTARGKSFYDRLKKRGVLSLTGLRGPDTLHSVSITVRGDVRELGPSLIPYLFDKNPYMDEIYPDPDSRSILTVFLIYKGQGEWFDLSKKPIERASFSFGGEEKAPDVFYINEHCTGCGLCLYKCPQKCIDSSSVPFMIKEMNCLHCGLCAEICPSNAVARRKLP